MHCPRYLTPSDIKYAQEFFAKYDGYTLADFLNRWDCNLSEVALLLDVRLETVSRWKHGRKKPSKQMLRSLAMADKVMSLRRQQVV